MLVPKLITTLRTYSRAQLGRDLVAGLIVGIVALPLAIAFAIASGVTPDRGLYTAIVAGFLISVLGGSRVQIGGPTGAFVVIIYGIVQQHGMQGLAVATMMAGAILVLMGLLKFGAAIKFIPFPVTIGFTTGIAVIIATSQVNDFFGMGLIGVPAEFLGKLEMFARHWDAVDPWALLVSAATVAIIVAWPVISDRVPGPFVALVLTTAAVALFDLPVDTIADRFGEIHATLPAPSLPFDAAMLTVDFLRPLVAPAFAIALLGGIESLLSAVVSDGMIGGRHRSNMELVAQGVANIASPLFGGIPATGAIARTATNVRNGGRTPVAGIAHAVTLLLIALFFGHWVGLVPMAALAGILVVVAYHMSEWHAFVSEFRGPRSDVAVMLATFLLTVLVDLVIAIEVGMVLAAFLFMKRMAEVTNVQVITREMDDERDDYESDPNAVRRRAVPAGVVVYEVNGPFFFGAAETFRDTLSATQQHPRVLIVRMRNVPAIDSTGLRSIGDLLRRARAEGQLLLLSDVHAQPMVALGRSYLLDQIGEEQIFGNIDDALNRARRHLGMAELERPAFATPTVRRETPDGGLPAIPE